MVVPFEQRDVAVAVSWCELFLDERTKFAGHRVGPVEYTQQSALRVFAENLGDRVESGGATFRKVT